MSTLLGYLTNSAGLAVAAALFDGVSATAASVLIGGAIITAPEWLVATCLRRGAPHASGRADSLPYGCAWVILMFSGALLALPLVAVTNAVLTGFILDGFGAYLATVACLYGMSFVVGRLGLIFTSHRPASG